MNKDKKNTSFLDIILIQWNVYISFCSIALMFYFQLLKSVSFSLLEYIFVFLSTFLSYNLLRLPFLFKQKGKWSKESIFLAFIFLLILVLAFICFTWIQILAFAFLFALTVFYRFPLFFSSELRRINYLKIFIIAFVWVAGIIIVPLFDKKSSTILISYIPLYIAQVLLFIAITLPFDDADQLKDDFKTIPKKIGSKKTKIVSLVLMAFYLIISVYTLKDISEKLAHIAIALVSCVMIILYKKEKNEKFLFYGMDGIILLQTFLLYLFRQFL